jgi:hypothetical protein
VDGNQFHITAINQGVKRFYSLKIQEFRNQHTGSYDVARFSIVISGMLLNGAFFSMQHHIWYVPGSTN